MASRGIVEWKGIDFRRLRRPPKAVDAFPLMAGPFLKQYLSLSTDLISFYSSTGSPPPSLALPIHEMLEAGAISLILGALSCTARDAKEARRGVKWIEAQKLSAYSRALMTAACKSGSLTDQPRIGRLAIDVAGIAQELPESWLRDVLDRPGSA